MKAILVSIVLYFAATAAHSMPISVLNANGLSATIPISDQCGDRCGSSRSNGGQRNCLTDLRRLKITGPSDYRSQHAVATRLLRV